jgi:hypothetical protein
LWVDLIDGQFAEVGPCLRDDLFSELLVDSIEAVGAKLGIVDGVLVSLVEDEMQDAFRLFFAFAVCLPDLDGGELLLPLLGLKFGNDDQLLQGVVEMLLVVVEPGVFALFYFLLLFYALPLL